MVQGAGSREAGRGIHLLPAAPCLKALGGAGAIGKDLNRQYTAPASHVHLFFTITCGLPLTLL